MLELPLAAFDLNLMYAQKLVADLTEEEMCAQPVPGRTLNHAAFVLGHVTWANDATAMLLGEAPSSERASWSDLFSMGSTPSGESAKYPPKAALLQGLADSHRRLSEAAKKATAEQLAQPAPEFIQVLFPTIGNAVVGLMTNHMATHLGQLSAWRRAMGKGGVLGM